MDRSLAIAFGISLACHSLFLGLQLIQLHGRSLTKHRQALRLIYEYELAEEELRRLQRQLANLSKRPSTPPASSTPGVAAPSPQIRIPDRPVVAVSPVLSDTSAKRSAVVDLTNLVAASQGDPVLLSYFSAIREQIQRTANRRTWLTGETTEGLVCISFVLDASGSVHSAMVLPQRSAPSRLLQDIALKIIRAAGPFPPFPPSLSDSTKTVVVPLEFLLSD